jgi:hypothetical protein
MEGEIKMSKKWNFRNRTWVRVLKRKEGRKKEREDGVAQMIDYLPSKNEALSSNPSAAN